MERLFSFILLVVVLVVVSFYMGWFDFATSTTSGSNNRVGVGLSVDKDKVKEDFNRAEQRAREIAENARREARGVARRVESATRRDGSFKLEKPMLEISTGWSKSVNVTREDADKGAYSLVLKTEPDSKLIVSGGEFKEGQTQTSITIEAPPDSISGVISVEGYGKSEPLTVIVQ